MNDAERAVLFAEVDAACRKAVWCALATTSGGEPRVRMVHPTWEGETLWFATGTGTPKVREIEKDPRVAIQYQVSPPDFVHVCVRGRARVVTDAAEKRRVWDVIDYDLSQFWPGGPADPGYTLVRIDPDRVEYARIFGTQDRKVWRRSPRA
jgi:general stress protein 26